MMKNKAKTIRGLVISSSEKKSFRRQDGSLSEKCRLYIRSVPDADDMVEEICVNCSGEFANYFHFRGMVDVEYVLRVYSPKPNVFVNDAYALRIKAV